MSKRANSTIGAVALAAVLVFATAAQYAFGDTVLNDVVVGGNDTITQGGSTIISYRLEVTNGTPSGDPNGCDGTGGTPATATITAPAGVTVDTGLVPANQFQFTGCGVVNAEAVTFSSGTVGSYVITVGVTGGKAGSLYATSGATFTLHVNAPVVSNEAPSITVNDVTVEGDTAGGWTLDFSQVGTASDAEDGTPAVECTPLIGQVLALGSNNVECVATDTEGETDTDDGTITVVDTTDPELQDVPTDMTVEGNTFGGADVTYTDPTAIDIVDDSVDVNCSPASGSYFLLGGPHTVTCTATDDSGNSASSMFDITVVDTTSPELTVPANFQVEGNTVNGATVPFSVSATDIVDSSVDVECKEGLTSVNSNDFFALGSHSIDCTATDDSLNTDTDSFTITVVDTTDPELQNVPNDMTVEGNTFGGADVTYTDPTATDIVDPSVDVVCSLASGSFFALGGPHTVTCTATDDSGNSASDTFDITVVDTTAPIVTAPADISTPATGITGAVVTYSGESAYDIVDGSITPTCLPASGSTFPIGATTVTCSATDASSNTGTDTFTIAVTIQSTGFYQPVDMSGVMNSVKAGATVPLKFEVFGDKTMPSSEITDVAIVKSLKYKAMGCDTTVPIDDIETTATGGTMLRYDPTSGQFVYNWKTPTVRGCYQVTLTLMDDSTIQALFKLK